MGLHEQITEIKRRLPANTDQIRERIFEDIERRAPEHVKNGYRILETDPMVLRFFNRRMNGQHQNNEPWMALAEQKMIEGLLLIGEVNCEGDAADAAGAVLASILRESQTYLATNDACELLRAAPPVPNIEITADLLPYPSFFISYESGVALVRGDKVQDGAVVDAALVVASIDGILLTFFYSIGGKWHTRSSLIRYGMLWPRDFSGNEAFHSMLKFLGFIASPISAESRHRIPREIRKELKATNARAPDIEKEISVISLRRETREDERPRGGESNPTDWKHHWWVSGHYRAQYCPSSKTKKIIWIQPHVKGPLDKPLLQKVYSVNR